MFFELCTMYHVPVHTIGTLPLQDGIPVPSLMVLASYLHGDALLGSLESCANCRA